MRTEPASLVFGRVEIRLAERRVLVDGQAVGLGSRGFDLLRALVERRDRVVGKSELLDVVWPGLVVGENNLQVQVSGLRRVLGPQAIATIAGLGYRFTLPPGPPPAAAATDVRDGDGDGDGVAWPDAPAASAARVLVADDNKVNRLLLCRSVALMGHHVESADDGRHALELLRQRRFDLLLLDLAMPGLDGFALLERRAADPALREVAVIVTSSLSGVAPVARCIALGADDFLHKPVDPWLLKARVDSSLARKRRQDAQAETLRRLRPETPARATRLPDAAVLAARLHGLEDAEALPTPQEAMETVSAWGTLAVDVIAGQGGQVARFEGDGVLAVFVEPPAAVRAAQDLVEVTALFNAERAAAGQGAVRAHVGIARGPVLVGTTTTARHVACTCLGEVVARAGRLCEGCAGVGDEIAMDAATLAALDADLPRVPARGESSR